MLGTGGVELPVPPVAVKYQRRFVPLAVRATAVVFWQYVMGVTTVGAAGGAVTFTVIEVLGPSHPFIVWLT